MRLRLKPITLLLALLAVALFPFGWIAQIWPPADWIGASLFSSEAAHAVGHALIFLAVGAALLHTFPALRRRPAVYLGLVLAVAVGQESLQIVYKGRGLALNDLTDIGTDLVAAGLVMALWYGWQKAEGQQTSHDGRKDPYDPAPGRRG